LDGKVYSGSFDHTIRVWSGDDGTHLQTLVGHTRFVRALAAGLDGKVYSGSEDETIRVWSGTDGTHLQTFVDTQGVMSLTVGLDGKVFSGSFDGTIRVWSASDGTHLYTLKELKGTVYALAVMRNGTFISGGGYMVENEGEDSDGDDEECAELKMW
jgi:WD40 repeat protein